MRRLVLTVVFKCCLSSSSETVTKVAQCTFVPLRCHKWLLSSISILWEAERGLDLHTLSAGSPLLGNCQPNSTK
uniref:Putative secreted protein n=1 Tax=Anopheles marajoara TaxID=58244 RepID=A0A2M4CDC6_9DIPT